MWDSEDTPDGGDAEHTFAYSYELRLLYSSSQYLGLHRGRGKHPFLGVYLQIQKRVFYSGVILYEKTESEEKNQKKSFLADCRPFL